jgi:hypothetical protein
MEFRFVVWRKMIVNNLIIALRCVVFSLFSLVSAKTFLIVQSQEGNKLHNQPNSEFHWKNGFQRFLYVFLHLTPLRAGVTQHNSAEKSLYDCLSGDGTEH